MQSNLVSMTIVYTTPSVLRHTLAIPKFLHQTPSFIRPRLSSMRHLESMVCHIEEVVNAKIPFIYICYVQLKYIHFHLETTWGLHEN